VVVTSNLLVFLLDGFMGAAVGLKSSATFSFLGLPTSLFGTAFSFAIACSLSNLLFKHANSISTSLSLSSLVIGVKNAKSSCLCFGAIVHYKHLQAITTYKQILTNEQYKANGLALSKIRTVTVIRFKLKAAING
jgi:hypothetical protein